MECDLGGTKASSKTIRLFVPYWIVNDTALRLAYRVVEIEPGENANVDSLLSSRTVKSSKLSSKHPLNSTDERNHGLRKTIQILEAIEDLYPTPCMLSPQDYISRNGILPFQSQNGAFLSPRVGISVAIHHSDHYSPGISLFELENKVARLLKCWSILFTIFLVVHCPFSFQYVCPFFQERIYVKAFNSNGSYYKLSALLRMASNRTKVKSYLISLLLDLQCHVL